MISILIATKNRPRQLQRCLEAICRNTYQNFEILIIDQNPSRDAQMIDQKHDNRIRYFQNSRLGKSASLNYGILHANGEILAFTDDDCIVGADWLNRMHTAFHHRQKISIIFGKTVPHQPHAHRNQVCPVAFTKQQRRIITKPSLRFGRIGSGNNMAIRKNALQQIGSFKEWLGPGSIGKNYEDAELTYRTLLLRHACLYEPTMVVYHDKWLSIPKSRRQNLDYALGESTCYAYFYFQKYRFAAPLMQSSIYSDLIPLRAGVSALIRLHVNRKILGGIYWTFFSLIYRFLGIGIGFLFALIDPMQKPNQLRT